MIPTRIIIVMSSMIPVIKPNKKYSGGDRSFPGVMLGSDCTGQPVAAEDDEIADGCVVVQEYVPA